MLRFLAQRKQLSNLLRPGRCHLEKPPYLSIANDALEAGNSLCEQVPLGMRRDIVPLLTWIQLLLQIYA